MNEAMREQFEATAWRVTADAAIHDCLNDDERDVIYFDKRDVPTGEEAEGFTVTPLYTYQAAPVGVPEMIVDLAECRKAGWNDGARAYRAGWNACRSEMLELAAAPSAPQGEG
jgi:hypothetical protein